MAEKELQEQMNEIHQKMDMVLEYVSIQNHKREEIDYFVEDAGMIRNLTDPGLTKSLNNMNRVLAEVKPDEKLDNKSLFGLFKQLNSPEVRKSLSYSLRLMKEMNK